MDGRISYYLLHSDLQEYLTDYTKKNGKRCLLSDAACVLAGEGRCLTNPAPAPNYASWDLQDPEELFDIFLNSSLDVSILLRSPGFYGEKIDIEKIYFFSRDVWPLLALRNEEENIHSQNSFCLIYVIKASTRINISGEVYELKEGSAVLLAPNVNYGYSCPEDGIILSISIKSSTFRSAFSSIFAADNPMASFFSNCLYGNLQNYLLFFRKPDSYIFSVIRSLFQESESVRPYASEIANAYAAVFIGELFRNYSSVYMHYKDDRSVHSQMPLILRYIRSNMNTVTLQDMADFFGYAPDYLGKLIKKSTGKHFNDILNGYKVEKSRRLLLYTNDSVEEISALCGFSSPTHFFRTFKKYMNTTPARYRREKSANEL